MIRIFSSLGLNSFLRTKQVINSTTDVFRHFARDNYCLAVGGKWILDFAWQRFKKRLLECICAWLQTPISSVCAYVCKCDLEGNLPVCFPHWSITWTCFELLSMTSAFSPGFIHSLNWRIWMLSLSFLISILFIFREFQIS